MSEARADHGVLYFKGMIYALGGMAFDKHPQIEGQEGKPNKTDLVKSINKCEVYSIAEDKWVSLPSFTHERQSFSVCSFNDKFIFIFGGKKLRRGAYISS